MEKLKQSYSEILSVFKEQKQKINRLWNVEEETANLLSMLVLIKKPEIVLELGTSNGYSTFHLAIDQSTKVITIDVETSRNNLAKETLKGFNNIEFITERIETYIPKINYKIDLLFLDANKPNYLNYLLQLENKLNNDALIIADNIDSHATTGSYKDYILNNNKYTTIHLSIDAGVLISVFSISKDKIITNNE